MKLNENKMQLFLMRHGTATFKAVSDSDRELTVQGIAQTQFMGHWLATQVNSFDMVLVSPFTRTLQTCAAMKDIFPKMKAPIVLNELTPNADPETTAQLILAYGEHHKAENVLVVSHMPLLGYLISELVPGTEPPALATSAVGLIKTSLTTNEFIWLESPQNLSSHA